jgi:hypothetical protein
MGVSAEALQAARNNRASVGVTERNCGDSGVKNPVRGQNVPVSTRADRSISDLSIIVVPEAPQRSVDNRASVSLSGIDEGDTGGEHGVCGASHLAIAIFSGARKTAVPDCAGVLEASGDLRDIRPAARLLTFVACSKTLHIA